jgi:transcriptional regulator with XRE-family HTH domain
MEFKDRLRELMEKNNLTCKELGDMLGVTNQAVSAWRTGSTAKPKKAMIQKIAELFDISEEELIGGVTMAERETTLLRNGSGYVDPTAYKALKKVETEMSATGGVKMKNEFKPGEIWESVTDKPEYIYYLVVGVQKNALNVLKLKHLDEEHPKKTQDNIEIVAKGIVYTDAGLLAYVPKRKLTGFIRRLTDEEFATVKTCILEKLGFDEFLSFDNQAMAEMEKKLEAAESRAVRYKAEKEMELGAYNENLKRQSGIISDLESKLEDTEKARDGLMHEVDRLNAELMLKSYNSETTVKMQVERDFYKEQYEKLFALVTKNVYAV